MLYACSAPPDKDTVEGYIEAPLTYISTPISGKLTNIQVRRGKTVKAKQILAVLAYEPQHTAHKRKWYQKKRYVRAPSTGVVNDIYYRLGEEIHAYLPIFSILDTHSYKVIFYLNELQLSQIRFGDVITMRCANCRNTVAAKINYIAKKAEYTPPILYNPQNKQHLLFRIEASIAKATGITLHPGQSVAITLAHRDDTNKAII